MQKCPELVSLICASTDKPIATLRNSHSARRSQRRGCPCGSCQNRLPERRRALATRLPIVRSLVSCVIATSIRMTSGGRRRECSRGIRGVQRSAISLPQRLARFWKAGKPRLDRQIQNQAASVGRSFRTISSHSESRPFRRRKHANATSWRSINGEVSLGAQVMAGYRPCKEGCRVP